MAKNLIVILGATASGKTHLAVRLASELGGEIISADSRQVYKGMDIGTGKDLQDYIIDGRKIPYHLIDIIGADKEFNLFEFQKFFYEIYTGLIRRKILPVLVGGSGLYLESIIQNYYLPQVEQNEELRRELRDKSDAALREILLSLKTRLHNITDLEDRERLIRAIEIAMAGRNQNAMPEPRPVIDATVFGIHWERSELRRRITLRLQQRLGEGMIDEVKALREYGLSWSKLDSFGLEYRYISRYLQGDINYQDMVAKLNTSIHQFAKRQETWFRRMEKKGIIINWIKGDDYNLLKESVLKYL
jgi:tRNA dimethylallyltransferase